MFINKTELNSIFPTSLLSIVYTHICILYNAIVASVTPTMFIGIDNSNLYKKKNQRITAE